MKNRSRTLFALADFSETGIQRTILSILNNWKADINGEVALSVRNKNGRFGDQLNSNIEVYVLDEAVKPIKNIAFFTRLIAYNKLLRYFKPEKVFASNPVEAIALCWIKRINKNFRLIVSENFYVSNSINAKEYYNGWFAWYYKNFLKYEYSKYADVVHIVSSEGLEDLYCNHGVPREKIKVIYNPVDIKKIKEKSTENVNDPLFSPGNNIVIASSRISPQKRIEVLLKAWELFLKRDNGKTKNPKLVICGDGPLKKDMERLASDLQISSQVLFLGFQQNPWKYISRSRIFVSTSEWEGLSLSMIEAQACGIPIVASDCKSGNREILLDGQAGFLFKNLDINECAEKIAFVFSNPDIARQKTKVATDNLGRFELSRIIDDYSKL